jgi:hypothetical protein
MTLTTNEIIILLTPIVGAAMAGLMARQTYLSVMKSRASKQRHMTIDMASVTTGSAEFQEAANLEKSGGTTDHEAKRSKMILDEALRFAKRVDDLARQG